LRRIVFNLHLAGGFVAAAFVVILGLTGSVMAFEEELDHLTHPRLFKVAPQGSPLTLSELGARATAAFPGRRIGGYGLGAAPDLSWSINLPGTTVYVNQYTGQILGTRSGPTWLSQVHQLHLRLLAGAAGKTVVSWAGLLMTLLTLSGLYLWWPIKRVSVNWARGGRRAWFDVHNAVGIFSWVFLFLLGLTGVVIGFESVTTPLLYRMTGSQPSAGSVAIDPVPGGRVIPADEALAIARASMPGAAPIAVSAAAPKTAYRIAMRFPEDRTPGGRTRVFVHPNTGAVLQADSSRTTAAGTRIINLNRAVHTGDVLGVPTKVLMSVASLAAVAQAITGLMMWWRRSQTEGKPRSH
jgi:uncharacterized iron-regulated membrane protein